MPLPYLPEKIWNYTPVLHAFPVPAIAAYDQAPNLCLQVSEALVPYLLGLLEIYTYQDKWEGTPIEKARAIGVIHDLRAALCIAGPCPPAPGGDMFSLRLENCVLQYTNDNGTTWYDVAGWSGDADTCFTGAQGAQGPEGTQGPEGPQGPPGTPGQDCDCDVTPPETPGEDGDAKRCNLASYLVDIPLPTSYQKLVAARQGSADVATLIGAALGLAATIVVTVASGGATIPAFLAIGVGLGGGGASLGGVLAERNPTDLTNEATPQFWSDVKCAIYCALPDDGILTPDVITACASAVGELTDTYPNAALVVKEMLLASNPEATAQYSIIGALYEGSNCNLCECGACDSASFEFRRYTWQDTELAGTRACYGAGQFSPCAPFNSVRVSENITVTLDNPHCIRTIRFAFAGNSAVDWKDVEYRLDGVLIGSQANVINATRCPTGALGWSGSLVLSPALNGSVIQIVPTRKTGNNQSSVIDVHCVDIEWGD